MANLESVNRVLASVYYHLELLNIVGIAMACVLVFFIVRPVAEWITLRISLLMEGKQLPPGSMGLPYIGETLSFISSLRQGGPSKFISERTAKFRSPMFKTNILLHPMVVVQGADANRFMANGETRQNLRNLWPVSIMNLLGWNVPSAVHGAQHKRQRQIMSACLGPAALQRVVGMADSMAKKHVEAWWKDGQRLSVGVSARKYAFDIAYNLLVGREEQHLLRGMEPLFRTWTDGLTGLPIDLPGFKYGKARRARDMLRQQIDRVIRQRQQELRQCQQAGHEQLAGEDLLSHFLLARDENGSALPLEELRDVTLFLLLAGHDTTTTTLTFALKFIEENPACFYRLVQEHQCIVSQKESGAPINWVDITSMRYTWAVLQETIRLRPPVFGGAKETLKDVQYNGYTIPKGWKMFYTMSATHDNDQYFNDSTKFDPSRFESKEGPPLFAYVPFGIGPHACKGIDFARMNMCLYIHHVIISGHTWMSLEPNEKYKSLPIPRLAKGYPILVSIDKSIFQ